MLVFTAYAVANKASMLVFTVETVAQRALMLVFTAIAVIAGSLTYATHHSMDMIFMIVDWIQSPIAQFISWMVLYTFMVTVTV